MNITPRNSTHRQGERGNALIYVLIAIGLFAMLNFTLSRNTDTGEAGTLSDEKAEILTTQILDYATQTKSVIDQMLFSGTDVWDLTFERPGEAGYNTAPHFNKVHHPEGGGLTLAQLPAEAIAQNSTNPVAGWYIGRFNNVEWTDHTGDDVILVAHQINRAICEKINENATGSTDIPALSGVTLANVLIDDQYHNGSNEDFDTAGCAACENYQALCVSDTAASRFSYYAVMASNPRD